MVCFFYNFFLLVIQSLETMREETHEREREHKPKINLDFFSFRSTILVPKITQKSKNPIPFQNLLSIPLLINNLVLSLEGCCLPTASGPSRTKGNLLWRHTTVQAITF